MYAMNVQEAIRDEIGNAKFCLIVDESQDESKKEQMAICVRFVDRKGYIKERFLDLVHVKDTNALTLKNEILSSLYHLKLYVQDIRGQGYDGASNMRGEWNRLKALILNECPFAYYHLNFIVNVTGSSTKRNGQLQDAQIDEISYLAEIGELKGNGITEKLCKTSLKISLMHCKTFGHSLDTCLKCVREPEPSAKVMEYQSDGFTKVKKRKNKGRKSDQQPTSRHSGGVWFNNPKPSTYQPKKASESAQGNSLKSNSNSFDALNTLGEQDNCGVPKPVCTNKTSNGHLDRVASGVKSKSPTGGGKKNLVFSSKSKIHYFDSEGMVFDDLDQCNKIYRGNLLPKKDIVNALTLVSTMNTLIQALRDNGWESLLDKVVIFCDKYNIHVPDMNATYRDIIHSRCKKHDVTVEHHYQVNVFIVAIDSQLQELNNRFSGTILKLLRLSATLDPRKSFNSDDICKLVTKYYPLDFTEQVKIELKLKLQHYELDNDPKLKNVTSLSKFCKRLQETEKSETYPLIDRLIRLILTLPVSTPTSERAFSRMKLMKTRLRSRMSNSLHHTNY
ncbi:zinc finger MYM-type protein 1-like protein [Tanacetum coccineum]